MKRYLKSFEISVMNVTHFALNFVDSNYVQSMLHVVSAI